MHKFFLLTPTLSAHSKWVLLQLIIKDNLGKNLSKNDIIELGCAHNKYSNVIRELQEIKAILKLKVKHKKNAPPSISYDYWFSKHHEVNQLIPRNMLEKLEYVKLRTPTKLVWSFFLLNQDEFGYVENFSKPEIAKACGLKLTELKTGIKHLKNMKLLSQPVTGCTIKELAILEGKEPKPIKKNKGINLKRSSTFLINHNKQTHSLYVIKMRQIIKWRFLTDKNKLRYYTAIFLPLLQKQPKSQDTFFLDLLRFKHEWIKDTSDLNDEYQFLSQQPLQVFKYLDDVLFRLVTCGLLKIVRYGNNIINPVSEEDSSNRIFGPLKSRTMDNVNGNITSKLMSNFANILIHYILFHFYEHKRNNNLDHSREFKQYSNWIASLKSKNCKIEMEIVNTPTKVWAPDIASIKNLLVSSNIEFSGQIKKSYSHVDFKDPNFHLKNGEYAILHCIQSSFAYFYKSVITSEQL
ncbi:hypothetical protein AN395_03349 [Pseudoalteromonas sp. P1-30]|uniref:hypothetical protein n=1 Tax=Pseudoalteromonas sp. P1-30 TaxID=1723760 RepID=UPI0006D5E9E0|nr:hypothetical protein [Pseudoalteromonas sp. P1-30]KPV90307.1 hypothetical protein AN395_03349 [Pseudoalteromonas sp. P1-30]